MSTDSAATSPAPAAPDAKESPWRADILSGFLVFLIALPLCLGIARASGFPVLSGLITAIIGGILVTFIGGAPMTIKGPAAGLIVIAVGCITAMNTEAAATGLEGDAASHLGYQWALAIITVAGAIQAVMGAAKAGKLGDFFPTSVVHGMLAAIGIVIIAKQAHTMMGIAMPATMEPFELYAQIPRSLANMNTIAFTIAVVSLAILYGWLFIPNKTIKRIPAPLVVVLVAVPLGHFLGIEGVTDHTTNGIHYGGGLVTITGSLTDAITFPDFSHIMSGSSIYYIVMFVGVGSIESLLSAKAIEQLDPQHRATDLNRDLLGVGIGNTLCGLLGGLPMIAEIVRSSANLNNGAKTRMANFFHGVFLLAFVAAAPQLIHLIPSAALAAMLVYTGTRLAAPQEFAKTYKIGGEQLIIFVVTALGCVGIDLLAGVAMGIATKFLIHLVNGAPIGALFSAKPDVKVEDDTATITLHGAAIFSNYLGIKSKIAAQTAKHVIVDVRDCKLVDHTVMEHIHELETAFETQGRTITLRGLDAHEPVSDHPMAARKKSVAAAA
jgi:MFS superfamily sulfate permease-like transporter